MQEVQQFLPSIRGRNVDARNIGKVLGCWSVSTRRIRKSSETMVQLRRRKYGSVLLGGGLALRAVARTWLFGSDL